MKIHTIVLIAIIASLFLAVGCYTRLDEDESADSGYAARKKEQEFRALLNDGAKNLKIVMLLENRERIQLETETDSEMMHDILAAQKHRLNEAMGCYKQALTYHPDSFKAHQGIALCAAKLGYYDEAIRHALIVLEGSQARKLIYRVLVQSYCGKSRQEIEAKTGNGVGYLRKAADLLEKYAPKEEPIDQHFLVSIAGALYEEIGDSLAGDEKASGYNKGIIFIERHLKKYPNLDKDPDPRIAKIGNIIITTYARLKNKKTALDR